MPKASTDRSLGTFGNKIYPMKRAILISIISALWSSFGFSQSDLENRHADMVMLQNTRTLVSVLQKLADERQFDPDIAPSLVEVSPFPKKIDELVKLKYLNQEDYTKLTNNIQFDYFPPAKNPTSQHFIILVGHIPGYVAYGFLSGECQLQKLQAK